MTTNLAVQQLIENYSQQISALSKELILETLEKGFQNDDSPARTRKTARVVKIPSKARLKMSAKPKTTNEYLPGVSAQLKGKVATALAAFTSPLTSQQVADRLSAGETMVRVALKHLIHEGVVKKSQEGRRVLYELKLAR